MDRLVRFLLNPDPAAGGGVTAPPAAPPAAPAAPAQTPPAAAPAAPQMVTIPMDQLQTLMALPARITQLETEKAAQIRAEQEKATQALIAKGQAEEAVKVTRAQLEADVTRERTEKESERGRARAYARDRELALALAGHPLNVGAAEQLQQLLASQLEAHAEGNGYVVRTATFQSAKDFVAGVLAKPEYAHFLRATGAGGTGAGGGSQSGPTPPGTTAPATPVNNLGEYVIQQYQQRQQAAPQDPRTAIGLPFGMKPVTRN